MLDSRDLKWDKAYFANVKVGDQVWDRIYGKERIISIENDQIITINNSKVGIHFYRMDGKHRETDLNQRLFYYSERPIVILPEDLYLNGVKEYKIVPMPCYSGEGSITESIEIKDWNNEKYTRKVHQEGKTTIEKLKYIKVPADFWEKFLEKSPIGLRPKVLFAEYGTQEERKQEMRDIMNRYIAEDKPVPTKWFIEYEEILDLEREEYEDFIQKIRKGHSHEFRNARITEIWAAIHR